MTDSHANDDPPGLDTYLVDVTDPRTGSTSDDHDSTVEPPADVAPELHEVDDA